VAVHQDPCEICERIATCANGSHPGLIAELETGWAVLGDLQYWPGYSLLLGKAPATELHEIPRDDLGRHLREVAQLAEAVHRAVRPHKMNYELLGNSVHHVHWHLFPRRADEPSPKAPVWGQMPTGELAARHRLDAARHDPLRRAIAAELAAIRRAAPPDPGSTAKR
jgi:diadenosine tetraphosphate (Ap4A) HIT family hydrolase